MKHLRRWGAAYILAVLWLVSSLLFGLAETAVQTNEARQHGQGFEWSEFWPAYWSAYFENLQSEWLQLVFQAVLLLGAKHWLFKVDAEDLERIEAKVDALRGHSGSDEDIARAFHEAYERLAPMHGYQTRTESAVPWEQVPGDNRRLMVATVRALREQGVIR